MKKTFLILVLMACTGTVFAEEISELYKEFQRREEVTFTKAEIKAFAFINRMGIDPKNLEKIEFINATVATEFVVQVNNGDICFGDSDREILRCKNRLGITSVEFNGDAD